MPEDNSVELRSEAPQEPNRPKMPPLTPKTWGIIAGVVVLLLVVVGGIYAAKGGKHAANSNNQGEEKSGLASLLGGGSQPTPTPSQTNSGLSGMPCDHANRRAIGVMLAGDPINRPMSGFSQADMVWELPVLTSDVTRLMAVYQCGEPKEIGSVRSARHDYLFLIQGIDGILAHWGGSYWALNRIAAGEFQTINALTNPYNAFYRKNNLPAPYNGFTNYDNLWNALQKLGYRTTTNFKGYDFKDDAAPADRGPAGTLSIGWPGAFRVSYEYDPTTNRYVRFWAGTKQVDATDGKVVAPSAVAIVTATDQLANGPGGYNDVGIEGQGPLAVYEDGKVIKGTWKKNELDKTDPMHFLDEQGNPIVFTRGQLWVMTPEPNISVTWVPKTGTNPTTQP